MTDKIISFFSLRRSKRLFRQIYRLFRRKASSLSLQQKEEFRSIFIPLQEALAQKDAKKAKNLSHLLEETARKWLSKTLWDQVLDFSSALIVALVIAIAVRQMWFELYRIPSGSMRPTFKEADFLLVSKTDFGINTLTPTKHFYFDPALVQRGQIVIFSVANMDVPEPDTMYFYLIPGTKQYVKRLIGKPGDTLYFYGGQIYGIDAEGKDISELRNSDWIQSLEHIPFIRFDGKSETTQAPIKGVFPSIVFYQMNEPIARLSLQDYGKISSEMLVPLKNYYDVWGFKNYAMARLLTKAQIQQFYPDQAKNLSSAPLYLEITHHPTLTNATLSYDEYRRLRPELKTSTSLIPVDEQKIDAIMHHMYTCRFTVKNGFAYRYGSSSSSINYLPQFKNIEDGTYEIQDGKAYRVLWGGLSYRLSDQHPLLSRDPLHVRTLYNLGIEMDTRFTPTTSQSPYFPSRYTYFRDHNLYLLGSPIFMHDDPDLALFQNQEMQRHASNAHYVPFEDMGPPIKDGAIDAAWIRQYGIKVPENMYLVFGDNHAMSADSRQFGFVPQDNLRGGASFLLWPVGSRWGRLAQPSIAHWTFPNLTIWLLFIICVTAYSVYQRKKYAKPLNFD